MPTNSPKSTRSPFLTSSFSSFLAADHVVSDGDDLPLLGLLLGVRNNDTSRGGLLLLDTLDEDPILKQTNLHGPDPSYSGA